MLKNYFSNIAYFYNKHLKCIFKDIFKPWYLVKVKNKILPILQQKNSYFTTTIFEF